MDSINDDIYSANIQENAVKSFGILEQHTQVLSDLYNDVKVDWNH